MTGVTATVMACAWLLSPQGGAQLALQSGAWPPLLAGNLFVQTHTGGYFEPGAADLPRLHRWSPGVKAQFYRVRRVLMLRRKRPEPKRLFGELVAERPGYCVAGCRRTAPSSAGAWAAGPAGPVAGLPPESDSGIVRFPLCPGPQCGNGRSGLLQASTLRRDAKEQIAAPAWLIDIKRPDGSGGGKAQPSRSSTLRKAS